MNGPHGEFLKLLGELTSTLDQLAGIAKRKIECTKQGDLVELDQCMRQEQVHALALKTLEKRRLGLLQEMGLQEVPLNHLFEHYPDAMRLQAKEAVEALLTQFTRYQSAADAARTLMERALRDIEKMMPENAPPPTEPGGPPPRMKTDLRA